MAGLRCRSVVRARSRRRAAIAALSVLVVTACSGGGGGGRAEQTDQVPAPASSSDPSTSAGGASCASAAVAAPAGCWQKVLPLGSGGFPPAPGSQNEPVWEPGKFPLTLRPQAGHRRRALDGRADRRVLLTGRSHVDRARQDRLGRADLPAHWSAFQGKLWMFGGLDYDSGAFLNDIWVSSDGTTWENAGTAAWTPRGGHAMAVHQGRLWLFGGANHTAADRSTDAFLNDVWVSDDGLEWTPVTASAPWSARDQAVVVPFGDALYLVGGQGRADVWRTAERPRVDPGDRRGTVEAAPRPGPVGVRRQAVGLRRVERRVDQRVERRLVLVRRRHLGTPGRARPVGANGRPSRSCSTTGSGSTAASTRAPTTTGAATSGR